MATTNKDRNKNYENYSVDELLQDDFFISSIKYPKEETELFWTDQLEEGKITKEDYDLACYFINSVQEQSEIITSKEVYDLWENIEVKNKMNLTRRSVRHRYIYATVASVAALIALMFSPIFSKYLHFGKSKATVIKIENVAKPDMNVQDIQLILSEDKTLAFEGKEAEVVYDKEGVRVNDKKMELAEEITENNSSNPYNQLIVPIGKRSSLTFPEGTRMWVNSGTRVIYTVDFGRKNREIYVDGEVFLDVSRDENRPFIVKTKKMSVEVLGTSINVTAYENDDIQSVVLVSGSVKVKVEDKKETILKPNHMYICEHGFDQIKTVDINDHISWKFGLYQYKSESLGVILKRLSRYYGQEIKCDPQVIDLKCSGKLDLKDHVQDVLDGITETAPVILRNEEGIYRISLKK